MEGPAHNGHHARGVYMISGQYKLLLQKHCGTKTNTTAVPNKNAPTTRL